MTHPQQPELSRSNLGEATQHGQEVRAEARDNADETTGGSTGPTPSANATEESRHSGGKSTVRSALER